MERRWHARSEIDVFATIHVNSKPRIMPCRIRNFSANGLFVETPDPVNPDQFVEVRVHPDGMDEQVIKGMVVHRRDGGVGIETESRFWARSLGWG